MEDTSPMEHQELPLSNAPASSSFVFPNDKIQFWFFCAATFLSYTTILSTSFLSVILTSASMSQTAIGIILSSPLITTVFAIFCAGFLVQSFSALTTAIVGQLICFISFLSFEWTGTCFVGALASRALLGFGTGLFFAAAMVYAKSKLEGPRTTYFFGIFSGMISFPAALAPTLAETYFNDYGAHYLFVVLSIPVFVGVFISSLLTKDVTIKEDLNQRPVTYLALLRIRTVLVPILIVTVVGLLWGFTLSFMALLLRNNNVETPYFFSVSTITLLASRIFLLKMFTVSRRKQTIFGGLWLMAIAYFTLSIFKITMYTTVTAAIMFGIGYSFSFPVISVWISDQFQHHDRGKPVALFGACFQAGIFVTPLLVGLFNVFMSLESILFALATLSVATSLLFLEAPSSKLTRMT
jgi:MFS family permease